MTDCFPANERKYYNIKTVEGDKQLTKSTDQVKHGKFSHVRVVFSWTGNILNTQNKNLTVNSVEKQNYPQNVVLLAGNLSM